MPRYDYYPEPEDDGYNDFVLGPMKTSRHRPPVIKRTKLEFPYVIQRTLSEPHRRVVATAISAALADHPAPKFKPALSEIPLTILSASSSAALLAQTSNLQPAIQRSSILAFNRRITDVVDRTNPQRPTIAAAAHVVEAIPVSDDYRRRTSHVAAVRLIGEGAQTIMREVHEVRLELMDQRASRLLPFFNLGMSPSSEVTDIFVKAMNEAELAQNITAALHSDANPEGLLEFGPLEAKTP
jgi:hypothetical protein